MPILGLIWRGQGPLALQVTRQEKDSPGQALIVLVRHRGLERGNDLPGPSCKLGTGWR